MQSVKIKLSTTRLNAEENIVSYLESQGYKVNHRFKILGKSGINHTFDMLAQRDDGLTIRTIAICFLDNSDNDIQTSTIFDFANKAYDTGISEKVIVAIPKLNPENNKIAEKQRIKVLDEAKLEAMVARSPKVSPRLDKPLNLATRSNLIESLRDIGYRTEEGVKIKGKSGVEHTFDMVAYDNGAENHSMVVDFLEDEGEIDLDKVALFDSKAYDIGAHDKIIAITTELSPDAKQFAETQRIKVIKFGKETTPEQTEAIKDTKKAGREDTKVPKPATKITGGDLRQEPDTEALKIIPEVLARRYNLMPMKVSGNTLEVAMADPTDILALEALAAQSKKRIKPIAASAKDVREAIDFNYKGYGEIDKYLSRMGCSD